MTSPHRAPRREHLLLAALTLAGCGGGGATPRDVTGSAVTGAPEKASAESDALRALAEEARRGGATESLHGVRVEDPYRALETLSPTTERWISAHAAVAQDRLQRWTQPGMRERLASLLAIGSLSRATQAGDRTFVLRREGTAEQPALFMAERGAIREAPLVDPTSYGARAALDWYFPSPRGTHVAFGVSENGDERSRLRVLEVATGKVLGEDIGETKWASVTWLHDASGFYYTRYPRPGEAGHDPKNPDAYFPRVFFHRLGTPDKDDVLVYGSTRPTDFPMVGLSKDDRWLSLVVHRGWSANDVFLFDRGATKGSRPAGPTDPAGWLPVIEGTEALTTPHVAGTTLYLLTNLDAPKYRLVSVPLAKARDRAAWKTLIAEREFPVEEWAVAGDRHVLHYVENVASRLRVFDKSGRETAALETPPLVSVSALSGDEARPTVAYVVTGYTMPPALFTADVRSGRVTEVARVSAEVDFSAFDVERVEVTSRDGTKVPVTLARKKGLPKDGDRPVLLTGYGGFNVSLLPNLSRQGIYWLERGGIYAVANLRGGAEFGESWHRAGNLENKPNVFDDFEAAIRWFSASGWSRPQRIGIMGGSNGGLLMGAMITRCPEAFGAAVALVGLYDMVRFHRFPPAELWVSEYGSAEDARQFEWLHGYSPYHRVKDGTPYPAVLIETADHDSRVHWAHSTKFAARLLEATNSGRPILFFMERDMGHGAGKRLSDQVDAQVRRFAFLEGTLGMIR